MKALKFFGIFMLIIIILVVISMFVIPHFYKDRIAEIAKKEINNQLTAEVDFDGIDLSLFRSFPDFSLGIHKLTIINQPSDTLATADGIYISVGLFSVLKDEKIEVKSITIDEPVFNLKINENGEENWDIFKESEITEAGMASGSKTYHLTLNKVLLNEADIYYDDKTSGLNIDILNMKGHLKGKFSEDRTNLVLNLNSQDFSLLYDDVAYLQRANFQFDADVDANMRDEIYNLQNNSLLINGLKINFEGSVAYVDDNLSLMLIYGAPDNSFKQLLSLIPVVYLDGYDKLITSGQFSIDGYIKGIYSELDFPDFKLHMKAVDGEISYPEMPANIDNINFDLLLEKKGNDLDKTVIRIDNLTSNLGEDEIKMSLEMLNPVSDPFIDLNASAGLTLENLKKAFPQESLQDLTGILVADINLKGNLSAVEKQDYKNFRAMGSLVCDNINYDVDKNYPVKLHHAQFNFSPSQIDIIGLSSDINHNQLDVDGKVNNYLGYFLKDEKFKGLINLRSENININQLLEPWSSAELDNGNDQDEEAITFIPENIDVLINIDADSATYDQLSFTNLNSAIHIVEGRIKFEEMTSSLLGGLVDLTGYYEATASVNPHIDMDIEFMNLKVSKAYQGMSLFRQFTPIAEKAAGLFDLSVNLDMELDKNMEPVWSSILGNGNFISDDIELKANDIFSKISNVLKVDLFDNPSTGPIDLKFKMMDGKVFHKPFNVSINDINMEVSGWTGFDKQIDYNLTLDLPVSLLNNDASEMMEQFSNDLGIDIGNVQTIKPVLNVGGLSSDPKVKLVSFGKLSGGNVKDAVIDKVEEVVDDYLEEANKEADRILAEAQNEADSIIAAAQKQADRVMQLANRTVNEAKNEAQKQSDQLVKEAAKNGPLAELAAKKAAEELMKTANKEADQALSKAQNEADQVMESARNQAESVMQRALEKADKIRE